MSVESTKTVTARSNTKSSQPKISKPPINATMGPTAITESDNSERGRTTPSQQRAVRLDESVSARASRRGASACDLCWTKHRKVLESKQVMI